MSNLLSEWDKYLLELYMTGFSDELEDEYDITRIKNTEEDKAYRLGSSHAIIGDEVRSVDKLSNDEILKLIKK